MSSCTARTIVLLTVSPDTLVVTEYSVRFLSIGHLTVGTGEPWLMQTQVKTSDRTVH